MTALRIDFFLTVDLANGGAGTVRIPVDTLERTVETDVFDEKPDDGEGSTGTATPTRTDRTATPTPTGTPTPTPTPTDDGLLDGGTPTATGTATPTPTPTPTDNETTTDDGGLLPRVRVLWIR